MHNWLLICLLIFSPQLRAAACCTSATAVGVGRLLSWEKFAIGIINALTHDVGAYDEDGRFFLHEDKTKLEVRSTIYSLIKATDRVSVFAQLPWVMPIEIQKATSLGYGLGDIRAGIRYQAIGIGEFLNIPALALTTAVVFPTGTPPPQLSAVDITDRGAWALATALSLEQMFEPYFLQLHLGTTLPLPRQVGKSGISTWYGPGVQAVFVAGREIAKDFVASLSTDFSYEYASSGYKTAIGASTSWRFLPNYTLMMGVSTNVFLRYLGVNLPANYAATLGLRYGYF